MRVLKFLGLFLLLLAGLLLLVAAFLLAAALLVGLSAGIFFLLSLASRSVEHLRDSRQAPVETTLTLHLERPRRLALWATGLLAVLVPAGALYGPLLARYADRLLPVR